MLYSIYFLHILLLIREGSFDKKNIRTATRWSAQKEPRQGSNNSMEKKIAHNVHPIFFLLILGVFNTEAH